jgi:hypothetical protein
VSLPWPFKYRHHADTGALGRAGREGVVADVGAIALSPDDLKALVDVRENEQGDLQWVVLVASDVRVALGVHTWVEGYLSPVY